MSKLTGYKLKRKSQQSNPIHCEVKQYLRKRFLNGGFSASTLYGTSLWVENNTNYLLLPLWGADISEVLSKHIFVPSLFTTQSVCPLLLKLLLLVIPANKNLAYGVR